MSTTYDDLLNAILAMDAYRCGQGHGFDVVCVAACILSKKSANYPSKNAVIRSSASLICSWEAAYETRM